VLAVATLAVHPAAAEEAWVVESEGWTLRDAPKLGGKPVGSVRVGEKVFVTGRAPGWVRVETGDRAGWVTESGIGADAPPSLQLEPLRERLAALEAGTSRLEGERAGLQEENARLGARVGELEESLARTRKDATDARASGRTGAVALGGGLVIVGWLAGYAFAALRRRGGGTRYTIG
jgi:hypothetical protein